MVPVLESFVRPHAKPIAFLVAYGELAIGVALVLGLLTRTASVCGVVFMFSLLFSANYPGPNAAFWEYFGASLEHLALALCFAAFAGHSVLKSQPKGGDKNRPSDSRHNFRFDLLCICLLHINTSWTLISHDQGYFLVRHHSLLRQFVLV